jgi:hypothetical protein
MFYSVLAAWAVFCVVFIESIFSKSGFTHLFGLLMIVFILLCMCYFALAISYKLEVWRDGRIRLTSMRRTIIARSENIPYVEGPHLPLGFIRFRLEREKGYLFSIKNDEVLRRALSVIKDVNPDIRFKNL